jgi:uncharacterized membrane protein
MVGNILQLALLTFVPLLELRASIPYGILVLKENWMIVYIVCILSNIILGLLVYFVIDYVIRFATRFPALDRLYRYYLVRTQKSIEKYVDRYGELGVAVFIGIPLPMSGVYSGSLAAYIIGLKYKKFILADIIGVLIAGTIVTIVVLSGSSALGLFIKRI